MSKRILLDPRDGAAVASVTKSLLAKWKPPKSKGKGRAKGSRFLNRPINVVDTKLCGKNLPPRSRESNLSDNLVR
jgi:hypothetical protein